MTPEDVFLKEVDRCFQSNGPFFRAIAEVKGVPLQNRPSQQEFARTLSEFLISRSQIGGNRPVLFSGDIAPGMGKTLVYAAVSALKWRYTGTRAIVATFTRQLREEIVRETPVLNRMLALLGDDLGPPKPVSILPYIAPSSACSLEKAITLAQSLPAGSREHNSATDYMNWVGECYEAGDLPLISDFFTNGGNLDFLFESHPLKFPSDTPREDIELLTLRFGELSNIYASIRRKIDKDMLLDPVESTIARIKTENQLAISSANIVVVTHAMLTTNAVNFGTVLNTNLMDANTCAATEDRFDVIIDEADLYHEQALNHFDTEVRLNDLKTALSPRSTAYKKLKSYLEGAVSHVHNFDSNAKKDELIALIQQTNGKSKCKTILDEIELKKSKAKKSAEPFQLEFLIKLQNRLKVIVEWYSELGNGRGAVTSSDAQVSLMGRRARDGEISLVLQAANGARVANRLWRNVNVHAFDHIAMISGTLTGCSRETVEGFYRLVGVYSKTDRAIDVIWGKQSPRLRILKNGDHRFDPRPSLVIPSEDRRVSKMVFSDTDLLPYDEDKLPCSKYWDRVANILHSMYDQNGELDKNTLVLLTSYRTQEQLKGSQFKDAIWQSPAGAQASIKEAQLKTARGKKCLIFGLNWTGVNYLTQQGSTLVERIVFPVIPFPVQRPIDWFYNENYRDHASRRLRQGMGRALRNNGDSPEFYFLDGRLPLPRRLNGTLPVRNPKNLALADSLIEDCFLDNPPEIGLIGDTVGVRKIDFIDRG